MAALTITDIAAFEDQVFVVASDGSAWVLNTNVNRWHALPPLPQPAVTPASSEPGYTEPAA